MKKPAPLPNPLDAALDVRSGKVRMAELPSETQQAVRRLNRFNEGKIIGHAAKQRPQGRAFLPGTRTRRAVLG
jgi:hypothetical protein